MLRLIGYGRLINNDFKRGREKSHEPRNYPWYFSNYIKKTPGIVATAFRRPGFELDTFRMQVSNMYNVGGIYPALNIQ
jgi:hypothetical protein